MRPLNYSRKLDSLGRLVIPIEIRKRLGIGESDSLDFMYEDNMIILKKHTELCDFCGSADNLQSFHGKQICSSCLCELKAL